MEMRDDMGGCQSSWLGHTTSLNSQQNSDEIQDNIPQQHGLMEELIEASMLCTDDLS